MICLTMLKLISEGKMNVNNLPLTLAVELAKFLNCDTTTGMLYWCETLDFWSILYRKCHGAGLHLLSGQKNAGDVTSGKAQPGKHDPMEASVNFTDPDVKTILYHQKKIDKYMCAGILEWPLDLIDNMKQFVLEYDAKRISSGLAENGIGDIDLWGYEGPPSLEEAKIELIEEMELISKLRTIKDKYDTEMVKLLAKLLKIYHTAYQ